VATAGPPARQRLDERLMPAGTNARFALVVVLALVTSAKMVLEFSFSLTGRQLGRCELAAGIDIYRANSDVNVLLARLTQAAAYTNCESRLATPPPWWLPAGWPLLVLVVAVFAFYADSWWKSRGSRVKPIGEFDAPVNGFILSDEVKRLAQRAGVTVDLTRVVDATVVDVTSAARSATVLGSNRRPVLCLHLGLVAQRLERASDRKEDPEFNAVLLHEFAHIRSGDVTAARGTIAVWRGFLLVALLPYLVIAAVLLAHGSVAGMEENSANVIDQRDLLITLVLACLGYLARSDVLRNREIYADREAVRNGADKGCWPADEHGTRSRAGRAARAFAELWHSHPSWGLRARSLDDPVVLFTVQAVPVLLAGVTAALIDADFQYVVQVYGQRSTWIGSQWMWQGTGALSAALVTLIVGVAIWRLVAYDRQAEELTHDRKAGVRTPATGLRTGLWLGAGMIVGDLVAGQGTIEQLVPSRPEMLLLVLAAGAGFGWWTAQCAGAWLARWRGRIPRWAMTVGLGGGFLILSWWFTWWADAGDPYSTGISISPSGYRLFLEYDYAGPAVHPAVLTVISWLGYVLGQLALPPAVLLAVGAAWVVPLLAWARRPGTEAGGLPSLRVPVAWAAAGAVATWACVIWAQAYMHETQPPQPSLHGLYELTYFWLILGAQVAPAAVVALAVGLRRGRFRLLVTLIAAEVTVLAGFAGTFVLVSADGCVRPLNTLETSCSWRPGLIEWAYSTQVDAVAVLAALLVFAACALALARPAVRRGYQAGRAGTKARSGNGKALVLTGFAGAAALGVALAGIVVQFPLQSHYVSAANQVTAQVGFELSLPVGTSGPPPAPQVATLEVENWSDLGGAALLSRLQADAGRISPALEADYARQHAYTVRDFLNIQPWCADIVTVSRQSTGYFLVPDNQARPWWSAFVNLSGAGGRGCESAISLLQHDPAQQQVGNFREFLTAISRSFGQIGTAYTDSEDIEARIKAVENAGEGTGYAGPGPLGILPVPAGVTPWSTNRYNLMNLNSFVQGFYIQSAWTEEERLFARYGFVSGTQEGWNYPDDAGKSISIARFSSARGAMSEFGDLADYFRRASEPAAAQADLADGGVGMIYHTVDKLGNVTTEFAGRLGDYVISVDVYTRKPDPAAAKTLLLQQYESLKKNGA
jgi:Zn-dependent protease with chaperone function